jgi:hypothetical protein
MGQIMRTWRKSVLLSLASFALAHLILRPPAAIAAAPLGTNTWLSTWSFNDTTNWTSDLGFAPLSQTNISALPFGDYTALVMDSTNAAWLRYRTTEADGTRNLTVDAGSISMWFSPAWSSTGVHIGGHGPGQWGRLFEVGSYTTNASYGWLSLYIDAGGTNLYFAGQTNNGSGGVFLTARIAWPAQSWHHLAITYSPSNSALYVDGLLVTNGLPVSYHPDSSVLTNGFSIGSDATGTVQVHGMIDNVATCAYPLKADTIWQVYNLGLGGFALNPFNPANLISANWEIVIATNSDVIAGSGYLQSIGSVTNCATNVNVWFTNVVATPAATGRINLAFTIAGGSPGSQYDVFGTTALASPINGAAWAWMGQGTSCNRYALTNLPNSAVMLVLGTPLDTDGDGLTDAFESLVSRTDPNNWDTVGVGISDGYQFARFGLVGVDPYSDPLGDGWTLLAAFQAGLDPLVWHQPPAPSGLSAVYSNGVVFVNWNQSPGSVTRYLLERDIPSLSRVDYYTNPPGQLFHYDNPFPAPEPEFFLDYVPKYRLTAIYPRGNSQQAVVSLYGAVRLTGTGSDASIVRGSNGRIYLAWQGVKTNSPFINLEGMFGDSNTGQTYYSNYTIAATGFTNGMCVMPDAVVAALNSPWFLEWNVILTNASGLDEVVEVPRFTGSTTPYFDGREALKENLSFLFRATGARYPVSFNWGPANNLESFSYSTNYCYAGFNDMGGGNGLFGSADFGPFTYNAIYRNLVFGNTNDLQSDGTLGTGFVDSQYFVPWTIFTPAQYTFVPPTDTATIPTLLSASQSPWIYMGSSADPFIITGGLGWTNYLMSSNPTNLFGLPVVSGALAWDNGPNGSQVIVPGGTIPARAGWFYFNCAQPSLLTANYYFTLSPYWGTSLTPLPGDPAFSPTNTTPLMLVSVGDPNIHVAGFAKQALLNGASSKYGYLGQYFDKACKANSDGTASTNETGLLSEYGDFFPTEPGPVVLTTKPDLSQTNNLQGQCTVNVIKLQLDVNHDGTMDLSFGGPDNTSEGRPFVFWINNDCDWATYPGYPYFDPGSDKEVNPLYADAFWDCRLDHPRSIRDLEDYARLWICGVPALTNDGYTATLSWTSVSSGSPAINILRAVETNGGTLYLTDTNILSLSGVPWKQIDGYSYNGFGQKYGVSATNSLTLPNSWFTNDGNKYFLFEGAGIGSGQLTLTITQSGQTVAQTSAWIDLHDVSDFYEQAYATNVPSRKPPSSLVSDFAVTRKEKSPAPDETKQIVVFIHGINNTVENYNETTQTIFKRLYWSGYHGRFASFRWPCAYLPWNTANPFQYNKGEFYAFKSATALKNYLGYLRNNRPDLAGYAIDLYAHSQGNVVTSEAILLGAPFDNYILTQGAFPAHCYDTNAPFLQKLLDAETNGVNAKQTPYYPVDGGYHGYCLSIHGNLINFFNTNDFALASGVTAGLQTNWEEDQRAQKPDKFPGGPFYAYDPSTHVTTGYYIFSSYTVDDLQEIKALVARSRSKAVGAQGGLSGVISGSVDLKISFGFGETRSEHSAQFDRPIQTALNYYKAILVQIQPAP